eukprot:scaffold165602_cov16-Prasinocladus_malaysianus.AAC.1
MEDNQKLEGSRWHLMRRTSKDLQLAGRACLGFVAAALLCYLPGALTNPETAPLAPVVLQNSYLAFTVMLVFGRNLGQTASTGILSLVGAAVACALAAAVFQAVAAT